MSAFSSRSGGYRSGVYILFLAFLVFTIGFSAPFWASHSSSYVTVHAGLWMACIYFQSHTTFTTGCSTYEFNIVDSWLHVVRTIEALAFAFLMISCVLTLATNCFKAVPPRKSRVLESFASTGGTLGLIGVILYGQRHLDIDWASYLAGIGSAMAVVAAIVIAINNREISQSNAGVVVGMTSIPVSQPEHPRGHINPGYNPGYNPAAPTQTGYNPGASAQPGYAY